MTGKATSPDGLAIAYETLGQGSPALVFVHGWSCDRSYWQAQLETSRNKVEVVIIPRTGHFLMMEDPERFNSILMSTIQKLAP